MHKRPLHRVPALLAAGTVAALVLAGCSAGGGGDDGPVTLTWYMGAGVPDDIATAEQLAESFNAANDDVVVEVDASGPAGVEIDAQIRTKLATGDMADLFWYNSGALMKQLNPDSQLLNVADEPWIDDLSDNYLTSTSTENGSYGAPVGSAMGGGFFYNIAVYEELGLEVPLTWDDFLSNSEVISAAGIDPVIQAYGDTWTSQMLTLADFHNVSVDNPDFGDELTANEVTFADTPAAVESFQKLQDVAEAGYFNEDFQTTLLDQALAKLANGEGAQFPILTFAQATIVQNYPDQAADIGFFAVPGESPDTNGLTTWMPSSVYSPATTEHPEEVKRFMAFVASPEGCDAITEARGVTGPYVVDGCEITGDVSRIVSDLLPYFESENTSLALEFISPVKGPNLQTFTVELGTGITNAEQAAEAYDEDNAQQAQQLGLEGW